MSSCPPSIASTIGTKGESVMTETAFRVVFVAYDGMTQLDLMGPYEILSRLPGAEVIVASRDGGDVTAGKLKFAELRALREISRCDLICVPGGMSATEAALDADLIAEVRRLALGAKYVASVCTGSADPGRRRTAGRQEAGVPLGVAAPSTAFRGDRRRGARRARRQPDDGRRRDRRHRLRIRRARRSGRPGHRADRPAERRVCSEPPFASGRPETAAAEIVAAPPCAGTSDVGAGGSGTRGGGPAAAST